MTITNPDWVPPIEMSFDTGKAIRSEQGLMLAGNPIALAQGKPGAPRLHIGALQRLTAGDQIRSRLDDPRSASGSSAQVLSTFFDFLQAGSIRLSFEHAGTPTSNTTVVRTRGGANTTLATYSNTTLFVARTIDVSVLPGDRVTLTTEASLSGGTARAQQRNVRWSTGGEDLWPGVSASLEGNTYA